MSRLRRPLSLALAAVAVAATLTAVGGVAGAGPAASTCAEAQGLHHAALVVEHGDGAVIRVCVAFAPPSVSGEQLLAASGVEYATRYFSGSGDAVCQVDGEPNPVPPNCFGSSYWGLFVSRAGGGWTYAVQGVSSLSVSDGDALGLRFETGSGSAPPPTAAGVCPPPATPTGAPAHTPSIHSTTVPAHAAPRPAPSGPAATAPTATHVPAAATARSAQPSSSPSPTPPSAMPRTATTRTPPPPSVPLAALLASAMGLMLVATLAVRARRGRA